MVQICDASPNLFHVVQEASSLQNSVQRPKDEINILTKFSTDLTTGLGPVQIQPTYVNRGLPTDSKIVEVINQLE